MNGVSPLEGVVGPVGVPGLVGEGMTSSATVAANSEPKTSEPKTSEAMTRLHHPYSASSLQARAASPYWRNRDDSDSDASRAGTAQHDAMDSGDDFGLSDTQAEAVARCQAFFEQILAQYPGGRVVSEIYVAVDGHKEVDDAGNVFEGTSGGYLDRAIISADGLRAAVLDWKFGLWSVEPAKTNLQGHVYLLGLLRKFPRLREVTVYFVMPHRDEIDYHTFTREDFPGLYLGVRAVVEAAKAAKADGNTDNCTPTTASCLFCGRLGVCKRGLGISVVVGKKYAPVAVPEDLNPSLIGSPEQARARMDLAMLMETWAKATRRQITEKAIEDEHWMPGGYLLRTRSDLKIKDWRASLKVARAMGVPSPALRDAITTKLEPLSEAVRDTAKRGQKEAKEKVFREALIDCKAAEKSKPTIFLERMKS